MQMLTKQAATEHVAITKWLKRWDQKLEITPTFDNKNPPLPQIAALFHLQLFHALSLCDIASQYWSYYMIATMQLMRPSNGQNTSCAVGDFE